MKNTTSVNQSEINKFEQIAQEWWDLDGKFKSLHQLNPVRLRFIVDNIQKNFGSNKTKSEIKVLDVGCGGGLVSEPLANVGFDVTAIDASKKNIQIAKLHAQQTNVSINYLCMSAEDLAEKNEKYDVVLALEIIEHVDNYQMFLESCAKLVAPQGLIFISTINKNFKSFLFAIVGGEYILRLLPRGTHDWNKFLKPSTIITTLEKKGFSAIDLKGLKYNYLRQCWNAANIPDVNYIMALQQLQEDTAS